MLANFQCVLFLLISLSTCIVSRFVNLGKNEAYSYADNPQTDAEDPLWLQIREGRKPTVDNFAGQDDTLLENYEEIYDNQAKGIEIFENDIIVNRSTEFYRNHSEELDERTFLRDKAYHWPTTTIPVIIDPKAPYTRRHRALILNAMWQYHKHTCIRFVHRTNQPDYIFITMDPKRGCSSNVGRQGGRQDMYLKIPGCVKLIGTTIHEFMHNLGFFHEQSRPDRDSNIKILTDRIMPGFDGNFRAFSHTVVDTLGQPYDYDSVMHYSAVAFSKDGSYTIIPYFADVKRLGQRRKFSRKDIKKVNKAYDCQQRDTDNDLEEERDEDSTYSTTTPASNLTSPVKVVQIFPGASGLCNVPGIIDAAIFNDGKLFVFKKGYFWVYRPLSPGHFGVTHLRPHLVTSKINEFLPKRMDAVVRLDKCFYVFANETVFALTSLDSSTAVDITATQTTFSPLRWRVRGMVQLNNQTYFSNGSVLFSYNPVNDAIIGQLRFSNESGLPMTHDLIFNVDDGRVMLLKGSSVYLTQPGTFIVGKGFPTTFQSAFC